MKMEKDINHALAVIGDSTHFPNIPRALVKHLGRLAAQGVECRILRQLLDNPEQTSGAIDSMFAAVIAATGLAGDELLHAADFHWHEQDPARIEAAFAEIRAVNFLHEQGFQDIALLPSRRRQRADIRAKRSGQLYVVEVAESSFSARDRAQQSELSRWLLAQLQGGKTAQLRATAQESGADRMAFIAMIDTEGALPWNTHDDFLAASQSVWVSLGRPDDLHVCAVTGRQALGYPPDDAVVPPWPT